MTTPPAPPHAQRGAAILTAMVIVTLVASLAATMMWKQWRSVEVEAAERARVQAAWILGGALDWARLILREDARSGLTDHLGEPWAVPLAEARLSTFLALDQDNTLGAQGPDVFLSGTISDAQARFNLTNLLGRDPVEAEKDIAVLERLCEQIGLPAATGRQIASAWRRAHGLAATEGGQAGGRDAPLAPPSVAQLTWLGLSEGVVVQLAPYLAILPTRTPVNANTAPRELLAAVLEDVDLASAERLVRTREQSHFTSLLAIGEALGRPGYAPDSRMVFIRTNYFEVRGRLRLEDRLVEEWSLVERSNEGRTRVVRRERRQAVAGS